MMVQRSETVLVVDFGAQYAQLIARRVRECHVYSEVVPWTMPLEQMLDDLQTQTLLGRFRGEPALDREAMIDVLVALSAVADARPDIASVDLNPLVLVNGSPVAVDALVELGGGSVDVA